MDICVFCSKPIETDSVTLGLKGANTINKICEPKGVKVCATLLYSSNSKTLKKLGYESSPHKLVRTYIQLLCENKA